MRNVGEAGTIMGT